MRVGIYTRISRDDDKQSLGVLRQERLCRRYAADKGWELFRVYCDNDRSASSYAVARRPAFEQLLADLRANRFDRVLVLAQDRLVRQPEQLEEVLRLLSTNTGSGVESVLGGALDAISSAGRINARIKVVFDAAYADFISERVKLKKRELAARGLPPGGGARPFGYEDGGMIVVPGEAALIREAASRVLAGEPLYAICSDWTRRGIGSAQAMGWRSGVLRKILEAPRIVGLREYRGQVVGDAAWPAILDERTYADIRALFGDMKRRHGGRPPIRRHLLSGIAECGRCHRTLFSNVIKNTRNYVCRAMPTQGGCGRLGMKAEPVEDFVITSIFDSLEQRAADTAVSDLSLRVHQQLQADQTALHELAVRRYVRRDITPGEHEAARSALLARIEATELQHSLLTNEAARRITTRKELGRLSDDDQRAFLHPHIAQLVIHPAVRGRNRIDLDRIQLEIRVPSEDNGFGEQGSEPLTRLGRSAVPATFLREND